MFFSSVLHAFVGELFAGMNVLGCYQFRVTRNSNLFVDEEEVKNLRAKIQANCRSGTSAMAYGWRLPTSADAMAEFLLSQFNLGATDLYRVPGPVNLVRLMQVPDWVERTDTS